MDVSVLVGQQWQVYVWERHLWIQLLPSANWTIKRYTFWFHPYFSSSVQHVFVLLEWFVRWEISGRTAAVLWGAASRICSKQHVTFLCCSHQFFSPCVSLACRRCIHAVVPMQPQLKGHKRVLKISIPFCRLLNIKKGSTQLLQLSKINKV